MKQRLVPGMVTITVADCSFVLVSVIRDIIYFCKTLACQFSTPDPLCSFLELLTVEKLKAWFTMMLMPM